MGDGDASVPDRAGFFALVAAQHGCFTLGQARALGYTSPLITHLVATGRVVQVERVVYRLRDYPVSPHEAALIAWLAVGPETAVISHESALAALGLLEAALGPIHVTVPRMCRSRRAPANVVLHSTTRSLRSDEIVVREGMRVTSPARTIADLREGRRAPALLELVLRRAQELGWLTDSDDLIGPRPRAKLPAR